MYAILCFGDSITYGSGEIPCKGWVGRLKEVYEQREHHAVYNLGIPGDTTADLHARIVAELGRVRDRRDEDEFRILIAIGMNDVKEEDGEDASDQTFTTQLQAIISTAKEKAETKLLTITPVDERYTLPFEEHRYRNDLIDKRNALIRIVAQRNGCAVIDVNTPLRDKPELLADGLHPNTSGYEIMFKEIKKALGAWLDE